MPVTIEFWNVFPLNIIPPVSFKWSTLISHPPHHLTFPCPPAIPSPGRSWLLLLTPSFLSLPVTISLSIYFPFFWPVPPLPLPNLSVDRSPREMHVADVARMFGDRRQTTDVIFTYEYLWGCVLHQKHCFGFFNWRKCIKEERTCCATVIITSLLQFPCRLIPFYPFLLLTSSTYLLQHLHVLWPT